MKRLFSLIIGSTTLAAMLSPPASAQECCNGGQPSIGGQYPIGNEYSNGGNCKKGRKEATMTPVEAFGVHPPGPDPADQHRRVFCWWKRIFTPYYAPASPTPTSVRWKPWCYFPLMPYYTPYYIGYCPKRLCNPKPAPYGSDGWGQGPMPDHPFPPNPQETPLGFGVYTSTILDDTVFWNMGGNGLVPYGAPRPVHGGPPDLVDAIQATRQMQYGGGGACAAPPGMVPAPVPAGPAILPPLEKMGARDGAAKEDRENNKIEAQAKRGE